ncbi:MAG: O-antigen ligase family protein [Lachnospiraceae bacterium]|nr:O-antigen ligase family protein [Lachnospiraceae bacterium]
MSREEQIPVWMLIGILLVTLLWGGGNTLYESFGLGVLVTFLLLFLVWKQRNLRLYVGRIWIPIALLFVGSILALFTTTSHGMAFLGLMQMMVPAALAVVWMQLEKKQQEVVLWMIPWSGAAITVMSAIGYFIPPLQGLLFTLDRMRGPFPYANVCGLYMMIGLLLLFYLQEEKKVTLRFGCLFVALFAGVLFSGCRSVFVLTVLSLIYAVIRYRTMRTVILVEGGVLLTAGLGYVFITGDTTGVGRFVTTSLHSATLAERIICWRDGWSVFLAHPLGLGYKGFTMMENAVQTGPYAVQYVHNDWLQMALDHGFLGFFGFLGLFAWAVWKQKGIKRWILLMLAIHFFVDFSLQYTLIAGILLFLFPWELLPEKRIAARGIMTGMFVVLCGCFLWLGIADGLRKAGDYKASLQVYPWNWQVRMFDLAEDTTAETVPERVEALLRQNPWNPTAYNAWSIYYAQQENYTFAIDKAKVAVKYHRYDMASYDNLILFYGRGIESCRSQGNLKLAEKWQAELGEIYTQWQMLQQEQDVLSNRIAKEDAYKLSDLSTEILEYYGILH